MSQSEKYSDSVSVSRGNPFEPFYNLIIRISFTEILFFDTVLLAKLQIITRSYKLYGSILKDSHGHPGAPC